MLGGQFKAVVGFCCIFMILLAVSARAEVTWKAKPLTDDHKMMMKNGAMKNMDKYMANMDAMKSLGPRMKSTLEGSIAGGKELFNSTKLSMNGRSCGTCHPGGGTTGGEVETPMKSEVTGKAYRLPVPSLVGAAATFPKYKVPNDKVITLQHMSNNCIMMFMGAQGLPFDGAESYNLAAYITTLSNGEKVEVGKVPEMMMKMMNMK